MVLHAAIVIEAYSLVIKYINIYHVLEYLSTEAAGCQ